LDYVKLGQPAPTLSGGEAQRVKLAAELARPDTGRTLYLLDEPTTGLHFEDLAKLLDVLNRLVDLGNTVVVIEHNLDVLKTADWIVEIGPEAGDDGGMVVACGTPEEIVAHSKRWKPGGKNGSTAEAARRKKTAQSGDPQSPAPSPPPLLRSHTGEALAPVLAAGPYIERREHNFAAEEERRDGDLEINQVGREAKMPWEVDGRRWHTQEAVDRKGKPVRWEGKILAEVVDRIHALGKFSDTNWNERSVVEIAAEKKSDGWFFHAITGESWILKLKFRTAKSTFGREKLIADLGLKPYNDLPDLPVYGNEPRVKAKNQRGPFQEIEIHAHSWAEIDKPEFWQFLERAVKGFESYLGRAAARPDDIMPWKVLGQKWHFARKGFPPGKRVEWEPEVLEELCELLAEVAPEGQFLWNNQQLVHVFVPGQKEAWASVLTKKPQAVELVLNGPKNRFAYGQVLELGCGRDFDTSPKHFDQLRLRFQTKQDLAKANFVDFLRKHRATIGETVSASGT
jgi:excinuclease ABC subunit A